MNEHLTVERTLPIDAAQATLVGRAFLPGVEGPALVAVRDAEVFDLSQVAATASALFEFEHPAATVRKAAGLPRIGSLSELLANTPVATRNASKPWLLAPCDLQALKAAGVTFVSSMLERVIEEQARGDPGKAESVRRAIVAIIGDNLSAVRPGSSEAMRLKEALIAQGAWSQYLEVGIGPDAEIFTKAQPMSAVGTGVDIGIHPKSEWNNPEPEIVLFVNSRGVTVGASLGNDVNLRDFEGRSALLLGKAKDNNASCAIGPFVRLFDRGFTIDDVRRCEIALRVQGDDGFVLEGSSSLERISRDPLDLVTHTIGANHQYPDGFALFLGTMFAPTQDRFAPGQGFTHAVGDIVTIATPKLGALVNRIDTSDACQPWTFGMRALMENLARRGLL
jgi:fumarylacetoacetate (FAA) hydrolase family protein